jgi:pimeloyl-ACP methyl ester carboxylesterase
MHAPIPAPRPLALEIADGVMTGLDFGPADRPIDLVFLHATGFNAETYRPLLEPIAQDGWRIVALDQRGHGQCRLPAEYPSALESWGWFANDTLAALGQLRGPADLPFVIAGHSLGGAMAVLLAHAKPDWIRALVLIDPAMLKPWMERVSRLPFGLKLMKRLLPIARMAERRRAIYPSRQAAIESYTGRGAFKTWRPGFLQAYVAGGFRDRPDGSVELTCTPTWEAQTFIAMRHDAWGALRHVRQPIDVLAAEHESTVTHSLAAFCDRARHAVVQVPAGSTHFLPMDMPERVDATLRAALNTDEGTFPHPTSKPDLIKG